MQDEFNAGAMAAGTAGGVVGAAWVTLSRPMARREVFFCLVGGLGIGAFIPPLIVTHYGLPPLLGGAIGFFGGVSVFGVFSAIQLFTERFVKKHMPPEDRS